jgi:hypothetical protein
MHERRKEYFEKEKKENATMHVSMPRVWLCEFEVQIGHDGNKNFNVAGES